MNRKAFLQMLLTAGSTIAVSIASVAAQSNRPNDPRIVASMARLKAMAAQLGAPRIEGREAVAGVDAPALYFGTTRINNTFQLVDAVSQQGGTGMTATVFVENAGEFIRISTSVPEPDGSGRATGTILDPNGPVIAAIRRGEPFYGEVKILGVPYLTGYEPLRDLGGRVIGIYYVGYKAP